MSQQVRVLVGGVPFGKDNVGDEAILECTIGHLREALPDAHFVVATGDPIETAKKLQVETVPLYGFDASTRTLECHQEFRKCDLFVWAGATGLSDYPENAGELVEIARQYEKPILMWGVGMNEEFNPVKVRVLPGRQHKVLSFANIATFGLVDLISITEQWRVRNMRSKVRRAVGFAELAVIRDPDSRECLERCGPLRCPQVIVGADSAVELSTASLEDFKVPERVSQILRTPGPKVGLCISAQGQVDNEEMLVTYLDKLTLEHGVQVVFIPMNPVTDSTLMAELHEKMQDPSRAALMSGRYEPGEIQAIAAQMDVVVSSRLHLLILASNKHVPIVGITRGTKIDNWLKPYGLKPVGTVYDCHLEPLLNETLRLLGDKDSFIEKSHEVREQLLKRLETAKALLKKLVDQHLLTRV